MKISLSGSSLTPWIEFEDKLKKDREFLTDGHYFTLGEPEARVTGSVHYNAPTYKLGDISAEENEKADEIAAEVEEKLARNRAAASGEAPAQITPQAAPAAKSEPETTPGEPVDLSEIPF